MAFGFADAALAQAKNVVVSFDRQGEGVDDAQLYVQPMTVGGDVKAVEMSRDGQKFTATVEPSPDGLYNLVYICNRLQTIVPFYAVGSGNSLNLGLTFDGSIPMAKDNTDNEALSAMGMYVASADRMLWEKRPSSKEMIASMIKGYKHAADSIKSIYDCNEVVTQYINIWGYTATYNAFVSLPNILGVRPDSLPLKAHEVMERPYKVIDSPMAALFPITPTLIANFLPRGASLEASIDSLYGNYRCRDIINKVGANVMEKYLSRFDYQNNYDRGLAELTAVTEKYNLDRKYLNTFVANRSTIKGSPFPADVVLKDKDGKRMDFSQLRGKYVYIDLWASWCVPCCREVPHLQKLEKELENKDVVFLSISIDQKVEAWKKKMADLQVHGNQWHDSEGTLGKALNVKGIPFFLIYDKEGKLYMYNAPRPSMGLALKELLEGLK